MPKQNQIHLRLMVRADCKDTRRRPKWHNRGTNCDQKRIYRWSSFDVVAAGPFVITVGETG